MYTSKFTPDALVNIKGLPKHIRNAMKKGFEKTVHVDPVACSEPLTGLLENYRSYHFGEYRVIYRVFEDIKAVAVVGVGMKDQSHHAEIYQKLELLAKTGELAATVLDTYRSISAKTQS
ncbi:MAG TPA: type II toxin-antitoxin system RelE/ParE family toxin [Verrucomicrobiae bacterium]|nr:type II toxin-antitoxin system RelE/ParE family toxin [Verrucomicrobiae bacterium]